MILVFDLETVPDIEAGKKLYGLNGLSDRDTILALHALRKQKVGHDFLPHHLQKIITISLVLEQDKTVKVWSIGDEHSSEAEIIQRFYAGIEKYQPTLVSWNGSGFDLPVLHYRSLIHGISAPLYWETGEHISGFRWNNYLNRYHYRHLDLMDILSAYQNKAFAPLDDIATLLGFPGKMGMDGSRVWEYYLNQDIKAIRDYCETDVLNTYFVYLRFELIRGLLSKTDYQSQLESTLQMLKNSGEKHLIEFARHVHL